MKNSIVKNLTSSFSKHFVQIDNTSIISVGVLVTVILIHITSSFVFITGNNVPPDWDVSRHMETALRYCRYLVFFDFQNFFSAFHHYPPLMYQIYSVILFFTKDIYMSVYLFNCSLFLVLVLSALIGFRNEFDKAVIYLAISVYGVFILGLHKDRQFIHGISTSSLMTDVPSLFLVLSAFSFFNQSIHDYR